MTPEDILARPAKRLSAAQRSAYFDDGGACVKSVLDASWLERCRAAVALQQQQSLVAPSGDARYDLEPARGGAPPRLRRINSPCDHDSVFWQLLTEGPLGELAADLLGPDVKFYQSKLNFKQPAGGTEVRWHQDAPFFPHTNSAVLTLGVYLDDCDDAQGPLEIIPGSHRGPPYSHYDRDGVWRGEIQPPEQQAFNNAASRVLKGPAGSVTVHNYRAVHGSKPNRATRARPLLLYVLSAADAMPYTAQPLPSRYEQTIVYGQPARCAHHEPGRFELPPDWSGGYSSIFALQQQETATL